MVAQSQPGGPPELYPRPRALPLLILMLGLLCLPADPECVRTYSLYYILSVRAVVAESAGCASLRAFYGLLYGLWRGYIAQKVYRCLFFRASFAAYHHIFFTLKLFSPVINSNSMQYPSTGTRKPRAVPCFMSGESRDCRIGECS